MAAEPPKPLSNKSLSDIFREVGDRKLVFHGPDNLRQDSRYQVVEVAQDFVVFKLLGDDQFVLPYTSILSLKMERVTLTIRYR